ncbi:D-3-phosphoglycerate dehydrogenase [Nonlabens xylanidelens]|uniref:D-3-phosphoglycerate dehydrogenase n=1 Tax=Nonlabens xylanidelens TaxID=191564 RepID=A0A2S6IQF8_9FLAO|nr:2-hydroxyacid dehydrogenase [Nonlabens xylanidelens]PPK96346.1 D-3-phosphoglycerate dehydrogenase [Nonlabens xylanidelens]PQJ18074.1 hydroxyacid dehydrogenase [Nonlabens xylanidelens]
MKILHLDSNHDILAKKLGEAGFENYFDFTSSKEEIMKVIDTYDGIVVRSRFPIDREFLSAATHLKCIGRVGAGLENIDLDYTAANNIACYNAPEGNRNAVGEHALGMLLSLFNHLNKGDKEVRSGLWHREENRGVELDGKTVGLIGYGNMGKAFAKKLSGFDCKVICYDIKQNVGDKNSQQVSLKELQEQSDVLSLHTPQTPLTVKMIDAAFIAAFKKPFYLINTARGKSVVTEDLVAGLKTSKILAAGLDVLEYEKGSFESLFRDSEIPQAFKELLEMENVLLSPHVAGWTVESKYKLAEVIADKIIANHKTA